MKPNRSFSLRLPSTACGSARGVSPRRALGAVLLGLVAAQACSGDDDPEETGGAGGSSMTTAGAGGAGGSGMSAGGTTMTAQSLLPPGLPGTPGTTGRVEVLATGLDVGTTVALREGLAWVTEAQLNHLPAIDPMAGPATDPFQIRAVSLPGGVPAQDRAVRVAGRPQLFPEGVAAALDGTLYFGSLGEKYIFQVPAGSDQYGGFVTDASAFTRGVVGIDVDEARSMLWACDSSPAGPPGGTLVGILRQDASVVVRHDLPVEAGFCNDIAVDSAGNVFVTESFQGALYQVPTASALTPNSLIPYVSTPAYPVLGPPAPGGFGANGVEILGGGVLVFANTALGTLYRIDGSGIVPFEVTGPDGQPYVFSGPDGITRLSDRELLVVENGFGARPESRLVKVTFDAR